MRAYYAESGYASIRLIAARERFVLAHVEGYFLLHYLCVLPQIPTVLVAENIEFALEEQASAFGYEGLDASATKAVEIDAWQRASCCVFCDS